MNFLPADKFYLEHQNGTVLCKTPEGITWKDITWDDHLDVVLYDATSAYKSVMYKNVSTNYWNTRMHNAVISLSKNRQRG